jgi:hypothetical protein
VIGTLLRKEGDLDNEERGIVEYALCVLASLVLADGSCRDVWLHDPTIIQFL